MIATTQTHSPVSMFTVFTTTFILLSVFIIPISSYSTDPDLFKLEHRFDQVKLEESRLLHQLRNRLIDFDDDNSFVTLLSRGRRTPEGKQRLCGAKIAMVVKKICPTGCTVDEPAKRSSHFMVGKRGKIATTCCESKCSFDDIKNGCCP